MTIYKITEKQNMQSVREPMIVKEFTSLRSAKIYASRNQMYHGTVLTIENDNMLEAYKESGKWS